MKIKPNWLVLTFVVFSDRFAEVRSGAGEIVVLGEDSDIGPHSTRKRSKQ